MFSGTGWDDDGADAHCRNCGASIYFDVGPGPVECHACGKNWQHTDDELDKINAKLAKPVDWTGNILRQVESLEMACEFVVDAPPEIEVDAKSADKIRRVMELCVMMKAILE